MSSGADLSDIAERWANGWVIARNFPPADCVGDALRIEVGLAGRRFEFVAADDAAGAVRPVDAIAADALRTPGRNWVTVVTARPDELVGPLRSAGLAVAGDIEWMMRIELRDQPELPVPEPYRVDVRRVGDVLEASAVDGSGQLAASGRMALAGTDAVADRILTEPAHRRRGLGSAIVTALATAAIAEGARTGILAASLEGERLYAHLGWQGVARLAVGRTPE